MIRKYGAAAAVQATNQGIPLLGRLLHFLSLLLIYFT
jgi:hypothetical protein